MVLTLSLTENQTQPHPQLKCDILFLHHHHVRRVTSSFSYGAKREISCILWKFQIHPHHEHPHGGMSASWKQMKESAHPHTSPPKANLFPVRLFHGTAQQLPLILRSENNPSPREQILMEGQSSGISQSFNHRHHGVGASCCACLNQ